MPELERLHSPATTRAVNTTTTTATLHRSIAAHDVCSAQPGELSAREQRNHRENWEPEKWSEHAVAAAAVMMSGTRLLEAATIWYCSMP